MLPYLNICEIPRHGAISTKKKPGQNFGKYRLIRLTLAGFETLKQLSVSEEQNYLTI